MGRPRISENLKLSNALTRLHNATGPDHGVIKGAALLQQDRELLLKTGYLKEIIKGWYFISAPDAKDGDTTAFFANYWEYLSRYLDERFKDHYCLTAEQSLLLQAKHCVIPLQISLMTNQKITQKIELYGDYSLFIYPTPRLIEPHLRDKINGVQVMSSAACLVSLGPKSYESYSAEIQVLMNSIVNPYDLIQLVNLNSTGVARLIGAYKQVGQADFAEKLISSLKSASISLPIVENPFNQQPLIHFTHKRRPALASRIAMLWETNKETVLSYKPSGDTRMDMHPQDYGVNAEKIKLFDAYHSLSIERYRVTPELIAKIAQGDWHNKTDADHINAMAALGYLRAFEKVKDDCIKVYSGELTAAQLFRENHSEWFARLFSPSVDAGLLDRADLLGFRRQTVIIKGSQHAPPHYDQVMDGMSSLIDCMSYESDPFVSAVLSHWLIGYIHPFIDGNGRIARFTMNLMLAEGGYPWTVIEVNDRHRYMTALELASVQNSITPFADFISENIKSAADKIRSSLSDDDRLSM